MPIRPTCLSAALLALSACFSSDAQAAQPATVRLDYIHSGNALDEHYAIERVLIEPLPWPGNLAQRFDDTDRGNNRVEVADARTGDLLYSRDFSTIFGEWKTTEEANKISRGFHESVGTCTNETNWITPCHFIPPHRNRPS
jgi:hypothetical protein